MAFDRSNFTINELNQGITPRKFSYITPDTEANIVAANYFNGLYDRVKKNDTIYTTTASGGTPVDVIVKVTAISNAGVVTVSKITV